MTDPDHLQPTARAVYDALVAAGQAMTRDELEQQIPTGGHRQNNVSRGMYALVRAGGAHFVDREPLTIQLGPRLEDSTL